MEGPLIEQTSPVKPATGVRTAKTCWQVIREAWRKRHETYNTLHWAYHDYLDSPLYQHARFIWYTALYYVEAFVWIATTLTLLSHVGERFWPAYIAVCALLSNVIFSAFYFQVPVWRVCHASPLANRFLPRLCVAGLAESRGW